MLPMSRRTYAGLTTSLTVISVILILGSIVALRTDWLRHADFFVKFAVFPGGLIAGGIVFLVNGCVEHYADLLPPRYRERPITRPEWEAICDTEQMHVFESILKRFAHSHGFRTMDAFQFRPEDQLEELMKEFYPGHPDADVMLRKADLSSTVVDTPTRLSLREYVSARMGPDSERASETKPEIGSSGIDRQARNRLVNVIRRYMGEVLTAFAFDEEITEIHMATTDDTVHVVVDSLWYHYDDCKDHLAGLSKQEWDYFQRLILLLESNAEIERVRQRRWSVRQVVAGVGLIGFGLCVVRYGIGWHLFGLALLFGPISILLSYWRNHSARRQDEEQLRLVPFSSISELRAVRRSVPGFSKRAYPAGAKVRNIRSRLMTMTGWLQTIVLWSFTSPLILLFQTLPETEVKTRIRQDAT